MNNQLPTFSEKLAGKDAAQQLLRRMGLDPRQFVLFLRLLRTLSEREEYVNIVGVDRVGLGELEAEMRWRMHLMKIGRNQMFKEVE
jgi:hypothetical protein